MEGYIEHREEVYLEVGDICEYAPCNCTFKEFAGAQAEVDRIYELDGLWHFDLRLLHDVHITEYNMTRRAGEIIQECDWYCTDDEMEQQTPRFIKVESLPPPPETLTPETVDQWVNQINQTINRRKKVITRG